MATSMRNLGAVATSVTSSGGMEPAYKRNGCGVIGEESDFLTAGHTGAQQMSKSAPPPIFLHSALYVLHDAIWNKYVSYHRVGRRVCRENGAAAPDGAAGNRTLR